ncbi:MAG: hypothetical protein KA270_06875 [Saprospiraceae bacterium]|nr:hypothetical protein [Saprospiraceae bacterium]MBP6566872.1 hypothetical protein [Saprospiraceae bacterium]
MRETQKDIDFLSKEISTQLHKLEVAFWEVYVYPGNYADNDYYEDENGQTHYYHDYEKEDKKTWLFYGTRTLFYKICVFLELKNVPLYYKMFIDKFQPIINDEKKVTESRGPLYEDDEPSMIIHDDFREFLRSFQEFDNDYSKKLEVNKLKQILENTNSILAKTNTIVTNETSIYTPIKWIVEIVYPTMRSLGKARFIKKFSTYHPDILIPEISSAVEYKYIRKGVGIETYLDQIKTDADNYEGDLEYKFFYAIIYFEDKLEINPAGFKQAVFEKKFPDNWILIPL